MLNPHKQKVILVTGGAGFIGSNFIPYFLGQNQQYAIINLDKITYAGNLSNLNGLEKTSRHQLIKGDICDKNLVSDIFKKYRIEGVVHFAAESHVDNSIERPDTFIRTNIEGTFNLLEEAKSCWGENNKTKRFHHISTDEVYGSLGESNRFTEETPYAPNSPYSASKASSDFLVRSYYHTYGLNVVTTNCSNNFGPKQHDEKLIPTIIRTALLGENIPIYGDGKNIRDWLYVLDHCAGINRVFHQGKSGETYLIGGNNELTNLDVVQKICSILDQIHPKTTGSYAKQIRFVEDRKGHDYRYGIDTTKIRTELNWQVAEEFELSIRKTIVWYLNKYKLKSK